jgi:serpin B
MTLSTRRRIPSRLAAAGLAVLIASACSSTGSGQAGPVTLDSHLLVAQGVAREVPTNAPVAETVAGMTKFGYDLYAVSADPNKNFVLSPLSIAYAFGMARAGATGATAGQIDRVFGFPAAGPHTALNVLSRDLVTTDGQPPTPPAAEDTESTKDAEETKPPLVSIANALFVQNGFPIKGPFLHTLAAQYGTGMRTLDFTSPTAKEQIDAWVREQTADRIKKLFDQLPPYTKLVLANAVYFKGDWKYPFDPQGTTPEPFTREDGSVVQVPTMHGRGDGKYNYAAGDGWQAVELPYAGSDLAMWVVVPTGAAGPGQLLAPDVLAAVGDGLAPWRVDLSLPHWDFGSNINHLLDPLGKLGLTDLGNFGGISDAGLFAPDAVHRANITVDEKGTEAAAVTGIIEADSGPIPVRADRPFAFAIVHGPTKTPLFIGHVADPADTAGAAG